MGRETKRICFLGKDGTGKSIIASNISEALVRQGYQVLQIGTDISLSSTLLLRGFVDIPSVLRDYREKYAIQLKDYIIKSSTGVYCMELGSIEPGVGCLARGISHIDEMLAGQGILEEYQIDYILYDISGGIPCTGFILPIRDGIMDQCVIVTKGEFSSLATANSILTGILRKGTKQNVSFLVNFADEFQTHSLLTDYAKTVKVPILAFLDTSSIMKESYLKEMTIYQANPKSHMVEVFYNIAENMIAIEAGETITPMKQQELLYWQQDWKKKELDYHSGVIGVDFYSNL